MKLENIIDNGFLMLDAIFFSITGVAPSGPQALLFWSLASI
jgi:hypothetical protein